THGGPSADRAGCEARIIYRIANHQDRTVYRITCARGHRAGRKRARRDHAAAGCGRMPAMKTLLTTLIIGSALTLAACGKDKKPATNEPTAAEPAKTDPAKADPAKAEPAAGEPKAEGDKPKGGW